MDYLSSKQKKIARIIQKDISIRKFPFKKVGKICILTDTDVLKSIKILIEKGFIRKSPSGINRKIKI